MTPQPLRPPKLPDLSVARIRALLRTARYAVLLMLAAGVLTGCERTLTPWSENYGAVEVRVRDSQGAPPRAGAQVELWNQWRRLSIESTTRDGRARFALVPPDAYWVNVRHPDGYVPALDQVHPIQGVDVERGEVVEIDFVVTNHFGELLIRASTEDGTGVAGVQIGVRSPLRPIAVGATGADGRLHLFGIPVGSVYEVDFTVPPGYVARAPTASPVRGVAIEHEQITEVRLTVAPQS